MKIPRYVHGHNFPSNPSNPLAEGKLDGKLNLVGREIFAFLQESVHNLASRLSDLSPIGRIGREIIVRGGAGRFLRGFVDGFLKIIRPLTRPLDGFPVQFATRKQKCP